MSKSKNTAATILVLLSVAIGNGPQSLPNTHQAATIQTTVTQEA
jgi:hypothetical protein